MTKLERHDIQGLLLSSYGHLAWSANVVLRIDDASRARAWLGSIAGAVTTAIGKHHQSSTNIAFTYQGLMKLGLDPRADAFPVAFMEGMASERRAAILGDTGPSARRHWLWGAQPDTVDILLMLFAPAQADLHASLGRHQAAFDSGGLHETLTLVGRRYPDGKEHFGFSDGIAQPAIRHEHRSEPARRRTNRSNDVAAGEFILGYENEYGFESDTPRLDAAADPYGTLISAGAEKRDFGRNGSYLVFRQLEQDVARFWSFLEACSAGSHGSHARDSDWLAAKFLGRWPSGAPLVNAPDDDDPRLADDNNFGYASDRSGLRCPLGSHIRRANPRDGFGDRFGHGRSEESVRRSNRHRLLRRGRPYGPRLHNRLVHDGESRGLLFICLNSSIERQFEFVQQTWLNNPTFCGLMNEVDPLVGAQRDDAWMTVPQEPIRRRIKGIERFVTTNGGAYFFLPSMRALRYLASVEETTPE